MSKVLLVDIKLITAAPSMQRKAHVQATGSAISRLLKWKLPMLLMLLDKELSLVYVYSLPVKTKDATSAKDRESTIVLALNLTYRDAFDKLLV